MNIILIGHVCFDHNISEGVSYDSWGSALMYMAHYFRSELRLEPILITSYGKDLERYINDFHTIPSRPNIGQTLAIENHTQSGHRKQRYLNADSNPPVVNDEAIGAVSTADIIVVAPLLPTYAAGYLRELLSHKKGRSLTVLLPQGYFRKLGPDGSVSLKPFTEARAIIPMFDLVIFSEDDCTSPETEAHKWMAYSDAVIVMTQGPAGASYITKDATTEVATVPVPEEQIIDSVGCGDIFSAALAYNYFLNRQVMLAIKSGNKAARARLFRPGPY